MKLDPVERLVQQTVMHEQEGIRLRQEMQQLLWDRTETMERAQQDVLHLQEFLICLPPGNENYGGR